MSTPAPPMRTPRPTAPRNAGAPTRATGAVRAGAARGEASPGAASPGAAPPSAGPPSTAAATGTERRAESGAETRAKIQAAITRIIGGTAAPEHAEPTAVNLAREAGVGRATLYRHGDLVTEFERRLAEAAEGDDPSVAAPIRVRQLERLLRGSREENAILHRAVKTLEHQVQHVALVLERERAQRRPDADGAVLPLAPRRRG